MWPGLFQPARASYPPTINEHGLPSQLKPVRTVTFRAGGTSDITNPALPGATCGSEQAADAGFGGFDRGGGYALWTSVRRGSDHGRM